MRAFDGEHFPDYAHDMQWLNCTDFVRRADVFKASQRYLDFQDEMIKWVPKLGAAIRSVPAWRDEWLTEAWLNKAMAYRPEVPNTTFPPPFLTS